MPIDDQFWVAGATVARTASGDNPVDGVDNRGRPCPTESDKSDVRSSSVTRSDVDHVDPHSNGAAAAPAPSRGADLAREALLAAQEAAKARGAKRQGAAAKRGGGAVEINRRRRRRWSGAGADDRDPQPLGRLTAKLANERGWGERLAAGQVFARWAQLVGPDVAEHAKPVSLRESELTVRAESTAWATQLRLLRRQLLSKIAAGVGDGVVKRIKVSGPAAPSWRYGLRHVAGRGPRDTYG